ncbi:hypothetical protein [Peribacillus butanolivorans]
MISVIKFSKKILWISHLTSIGGTELEELYISIQVIVMFLLEQPEG